MKALGDYIHSKGLKYGLYTAMGKTTCQGYVSNANMHAPARIELDSPGDL